MKTIRIISFCLFLNSCQDQVGSESSSVNEEQAISQEAVFYKLVRCQDHLCVRSLINDPNKVNPVTELKIFDSVRIQRCELQQVPKISTAKCEDIQVYRGEGAPVAQLGLLAIEKQYLKQESSEYIDEAVSLMKLFVDEANICKTNGFFSSNYNPQSAALIEQYRSQYSSIVKRAVPFFHAYLNPESGSPALNLSGQQALALSSGVQISDRVDPNGRYTLEVLKFEPKLNIGIDISWPDLNDLSVGNLSDVQDTIKSLIALGNADGDTLKKLRDTTISGLEVVKDLWDSYPLDIASHHVGVSFSPKGISSSIGQFLDIAAQKGQFARVEHPTIDPIKYAWQIFHGHTVGQLGTAAVAIGDVRKFVNSGLGVYTSLAFVVREGGKDGPIVDSFVYPYRRQDHGLLSLEELKTLYKGNFTSIVSSKSFSGAKYISFLEQNAKNFIDDIAQAKRLRQYHVNQVEGLVDRLTPIPGLDEDPEKLRGQIREKINGYILAANSVKKMDRNEKEAIRQAVEVEIKRDILRIALDELGFNSNEYRNIALASVVNGDALSSKDFESFAGDEIDRMFKELLSDKLMSDAEFAKYRVSRLFQFKEKIRILDLATFADKVIKPDNFDLSILRKELFGDLNLGPRVDRALEAHMLPLLKGYKSLQDPKPKQKKEFKTALKVQMKYDFLKFAVTEYGYENAQLKAISDQRQYSIFDIFKKENKSLLTSENIEAIYEDFINDQELGRFKSPSGDNAFRDFMKVNGGSLRFQNPQLYRYQGHIRYNVDFDALYEEVLALNKTKDFAERKAHELIGKIGPESCEASCQLLKTAGFDYDGETVARNIYADLKKQANAQKVSNPNADRAFTIRHDSFDVELFGDSRATLGDTNDLLKTSPFVPKDLPDGAVNRPGVPDRIKIRLTDTPSCQDFNYGQTILYLESLFLKMRQNAMFIEFMSP